MLLEMKICVAKEDVAFLMDSAGFLTQCFRKGRPTIQRGGAE